MATINNPACIVVASNTGIANCKVYPSIVKAMILLPRGKVLTDAECADLKTTLAALYIASTSARAYPITEVMGFKDNSKEEVKGSYGYGAEVYLKRMIYSFEFELNNGIAHANRTRSFNFPNNGYDVLLVDEKMYIWGAKSVTAGVVGLKGYSVNFTHTKDMMLTDGTKPQTTLIEVNLKNTKEFNEDIAFVPDSAVNFELSDMKGMIDLVHTATGGADKISLSVYTADDGINLFDLYSSQFASLALWVVKKAGVVKAVGTSANDLVSIAANAVTKQWDITLYTGSSGSDFTVEMAAPATLAAAGIGGTPNNYYEDLTVVTSTAVS